MTRNIERWTREVADDPGAASFVRLARAYRAQGRREAARDVVLQGLEHNPEHLGGHGLLALIHVEAGERERAGDEWETMLRLDPDNFDASRGLGFLALERNDLAAARRHLERAARSRPDDPAVTQALQVLERRERAAHGESGDGGPPVDRARETDPSGNGAERRAGRGGSPSGVGTTSGAPGVVHRAGRGPAASGRAEPSAAARTNGVRVRDPARLFDELAEDVPFVGAVVLDDQGLVVAGDIPLEGARSELLGALINTAVVEARRTTAMLGLDGWTGLLLDCDEATLHVAALPDDAVVLLAVRADAPAGWAVRAAARARSLAREFLEAQP